MLLLALLVAACAGPSAVSGQETGGPIEPRVSSPAELPERVPEPEPTRKVVTGEVPGELIDRMRADLAARIGETAAASAIVKRAEAVQWSDGSLGCPEPGQFYTQAIVPGYAVELEAGGTIYAYHASTKGYFKLCPTGPRRPLQVPRDASPKE